MKKVYFAVIFFVCSLLFAQNLDPLARVYINHRINGIPIPGYVFFDGFDFKGYKPETGGIVPMLRNLLS